MIMRFSINGHVVDHHLDGVCKLFASSGQDARLLSPHHGRPPPRVPDHRVEWTRGRSPSIPSQKAPPYPQWAPRPPQRRRSQQVPSVCLGVVLSSDSSQFTAFPSNQYWDLSYSPFYVHVSPSRFCCAFRKPILHQICVNQNVFFAR